MREEKEEEGAGGHLQRRQFRASRHSHGTSLAYKEKDADDVLPAGRQKITHAMRNIRALKKSGTTRGVARDKACRSASGRQNAAECARTHSQLTLCAQCKTQLADMCKNASN